MKAKLYRINDTKRPTPQQMLKMAENLKTHFEKFATVEAIAKVYVNTDTKKMEFNIYIEDQKPPWNHFDTWPECLAYYRKLMKEKEA